MEVKLLGEKATLLEVEDEKVCNSSELDGEDSSF